MFHTFAKSRLLFLICSISLIISIPIVFGQAQKGSLCIGSPSPSTAPEVCDNEQTNLICYRGSCQCPDAHDMPDADIHRSLLMRWHHDHDKCFAVKGSMCDLHPKKRRAACWPGIKCDPNPSTPEAGICGGGAQYPIIIFVFFGTLLITFTRKYIMCT